MTEKRYDVIYEKEPRGQVVTDEGVPCTARTCCTRLNALTEENEQYHKYIERVDKINHDLREENEELEQRNNRQAKQLDNIYHLIEKQDWKTLTGLIQEFQECEEQLQKEWKCYE